MAKTQQPKQRWVASFILQEAPVTRQIMVAVNRSFDFILSLYRPSLLLIYTFPLSLFTVLPS